jgi:small subunit ribosomal protein S9
MAKDKGTAVPEQKVKKGFIAGTGRRKTAVARVFLYQDKGDFIINGMDVSTYFPGEVDKTAWMKPFHAIGVSHPTAQFSGTVKVTGSGKSAQLGAVVHAISRALAEISEEYAKTLRKQGLLTRDSRMVERKKYYLRKARKSPQYSKR